MKKNPRALFPKPALIALAALLPVLAGGQRATAAAPRMPPAAAIESPRDLPYYDLAWVKGLSLEDMHARVLARDRQDGCTILNVEFDAFDQPMVGPKGMKTVRWRQRAVLVLPPKSEIGKALAYNVHDVAFGDKSRPRTYVSINLSIAKAFGIPVMVHGWMPDVAKAVSGSSYHDAQEGAMRALLAARIERAKDLPADGRYLFNGNPLVKGDMVALTLLQRLVEREAGLEVTEIASMGNSKEGLAHWALGALDDRVAVLAPGGSYLHDMRGMLEHYRKDLSWRLPWKSATEPQWVGLANLFDAVYHLGDWVLETEAGQVLGRTSLSPASWYRHIHAKHLVVFGDLGITPGQHDGVWPFWAENEPLSRLQHPSWRYVRIHDADGTFMYENGIGEMGLSLLPHMADLLINDAVLPGKPAVELTEVGERQIRVRARASFTAGLPREMLVVYAISPERGLRDREYWHFEPAREVEPGTWEKVLPPVAPGHGLAVIVIARERATAGELSFWRSASSLPIERYPVPQFHDAPATPDWRNTRRN